MLITYDSWVMNHIIDRVVTRSFWIIGRVVTLWWFAGIFSGVPVTYRVFIFQPSKMKRAHPIVIVDRRACPNPKRREGIPKRDSITVDPRNETVTVLLIYVTISNYVIEWSRKKKMRSGTDDDVIWMTSLRWYLIGVSHISDSSFGCLLFNSFVFKFIDLGL